MNIPAFCLTSILALPIAVLGANVTTTASRDYIEHAIKAAMTDIPFDSIKWINQVYNTYILEDPMNFAVGSYGSKNSVMYRDSVHISD